ncbi:pentapeptide repeat-containing protein [Pectobacterium aroidearum]|uniref:pentapeptide repeat-containing protein n=1 Tax=Pectobacterium aroidearum TaxID=1201031 RepID=UPI0032EB0A00
MEDSEHLNMAQYGLILKCAELKDFTEWNNYIENLDGVIRLEGANFDGINFTDAKFYRSSGIGVNLSEATFRNSKMVRVDFSDCNLINSNFEHAEFDNCFFNEASLSKAQFQNAKLFRVDFIRANLNYANFKNTEFFESNFYEAQFYHANLEGAKLIGGGYNPLVQRELRMNLCGTIFRDAKFNNETYFGLFYVSRETDFRSISFEAANYSAGLRQTLQYCNRRHNWEDWYRKQGKILAFFVKKFWSYSDYGFSTKQIIKSFFSINLFFSIIYFLFPSLINGLNPFDPIGSIYFSFVTMTTLGFGDMHAADNSIARCIIIIQVLYGYVLLGGLITVLSTLFNSDGPPQGLIKHPPHNDIKITIKISDL